MDGRIPLFPLGTVLLPGLVLPLHVFEDRYRRLVRDLLAPAGDGPARFGVVAIRAGREVGTDGARTLWEVGCAAVLRRVEEHDDGRFDLVTVGSERFRLRTVDRSAAPYLVGEVDWLDEVAGGPPERVTRVAREVAAAFTAYRQAVGGGPAGRAELLEDPRGLSYLVAAAMVLDLPDRQRLLAAASDLARLRAEARLLRREITLLGTLRSLPAVELTRVPPGPN